MAKSVIFVHTPMAVLAMLFLAAILPLSFASQDPERVYHLREKYNRRLCGVQVCSEPQNGDIGSISEPLDILIIGSGLAALGASREIELSNQLNHNDPVTYQIVEGDNNIGGRITAAKWISGGEGHPLANIMQKHFGGNGFDHQIQRWNDAKYIDTFQKIRDRRTMWWDFEDAYMCVQDKAVYFRDVADDQVESSSLEAAFAECGWPASSSVGDINRIIPEWLNTDFEFALEPSSTSLLALPLYPYIDFQDVDWFLYDSRGPREIAAREYMAFGICPNICLNRKVDKVHWQEEDGLVKVETSGDGGPITYCANQVISTVSVGVLDHDGETLFGSAITDKLEAMSRTFTMAKYYTIVFQFAEKFWEDDYEFIFVTPVQPKERGRCNVWQVLDTKWGDFYPGTNAIQCTVTTEVADELDLFYAEASDVTDLIRPLSRMYHFNDIPICERCVPGVDCGYPIGSPPLDSSVCRYRVFEPAEDKALWCGSYESFKAGATKADFNKFTEPLVSTAGDKLAVHFAGGAACYRHTSFTSGAIYSGIKAGNAALREYYKGVQNPTLPKTPQFCDETPEGGLGNLRPPKGIP